MNICDSFGATCNGQIRNECVLYIKTLDQITNRLGFILKKVTECRVKNMSELCFFICNKIYYSFIKQLFSHSPILYIKVSSIYPYIISFGHDDKTIQLFCHTISQYIYIVLKYGDTLIYYQTNLMILAVPQIQFI